MTTAKILLGTANDCARKVGVVSPQFLRRLNYDIHAGMTVVEANC